MLQNQSMLLTLLFVLVTFLAIWLIVRAAPRNKIFIVSLVAWLIIQAVLGYTGFYTKNNGLPPRIMLMVVPPLASIIALLLTAAGRRWLDKFDIAKTTWVHVVRVPVEISLFWLFMLKLVPQSMTFEGGNLDILSGITAPFVAIALRRNNIKKSWAIAWNFICLGLLLNVVLHGILAAPSPLQQIAFDQPNVAIFYFPFVWLPSMIVPAVLLSHVICLRKLFQKSTSQSEPSSLAKALV